jgi:hypothetical protein
MGIPGMNSENSLRLGQGKFYSLIFMLRYMIILFNFR